MITTQQSRNSTIEQVSSAEYLSNVMLHVAFVPNEQAMTINKATEATTTSESFGSDAMDYSLASAVVAVIDVYRASTSICMALAAGARAVIPFAELAEAQRYYNNSMPDERTHLLLCGERGGHRPEGFHLGNSPLSYTSDAVYGKTLLLTTTNGTRALQAVQDAQSVCVAAFVNASAAARWMVAELVRQRRTWLLIVCAASNTAVSYEDTLCAGLLVHLIQQECALLLQHSRYDRQFSLLPITDMLISSSIGASSAASSAIHCSDAARIAAELYRASGQMHHDAFKSALKTTEHGRTLVRLGYGADLEVCASRNILTIVPVLQGEALVLH
jgi:2-phosphosulfolactate phosphatase